MSTRSKRTGVPTRKFGFGGYVEPTPAVPATAPGVPAEPMEVAADTAAARRPVTRPPRGVRNPQAPGSKRFGFPAAHAHAEKGAAADHVEPPAAAAEQAAGPAAGKAPARPKGEPTGPAMMMIVVVMTAFCACLDVPLGVTPPGLVMPTGLVVGKRRVSGLMSPSAGRRSGIPRWVMMDDDDDDPHSHCIRPLLSPR
jgi:hypothetical protein